MGFFYITNPVINKIDASPLHDENSILVCKVEIPSIVKTLNKILITRNV